VQDWLNALVQSTFSWWLVVQLIVIDIGLDPGRYRNSSSGRANEWEFFSLDSQRSDMDRFRDADPFLVRCRHCEAQQSFSPITDRDVRFLSLFE
jgi:hypothetical protein